MSDSAYEKAVLELKKEFKQANPRTGIVQKLMEKTKSRRRKWINSSKYNSLELIEEFLFFALRHG